MGTEQHLDAEDVLIRICWGLGCNIPLVCYFTDDFSLAMLNEESLTRLRKSLLESRTQAVSFVTAGKLPELFGNGTVERSFGMNPPKFFVPPMSFQCGGRWASRCAEGIRYLVDYQISHSRE